MRGHLRRAVPQSLKLLVLLLLLLPAPARIQAGVKEPRPPRQSLYEGTTSAVVKLPEANGQIGEYPASVMDEQVVITVPGHVRSELVGTRARWGVTPIPGKRYDGSAETGTQWTMLVNPKLSRLGVMNSKFVDTYLYCAFHRKQREVSTERHDPDATRFDLADRDLMKCSIQYSFGGESSELGDPGLVAIAAGVTTDHLRKLFESGALRMAITAANAAEEIDSQFTRYKDTVFTQCVNRLGPKPKGSSGFAAEQFKHGVEVARWTYKHAECIASGVAEKDRPFWKRWVEGRRRDLQAIEWRARNLNPGGPNPIQYDGHGGYKRGTCRACMP